MKAEDLIYYGWTNASHELPLSERSAAVAAEGSYLLAMPVADWTKHLRSNCNISLSADELRELQEASNFSAAHYEVLRAQAIVACADIWPVRVRDGQLEAFLIERVEPNPKKGLERACLNHFYWPVGGRFRRVSEKHPLYSKFTPEVSALLKLHEEGGVSFSDVQSLYGLGGSETTFQSQMTYYYTGPSEIDRVCRHVTLQNPMSTISLNYVALLHPRATIHSNHTRGIGKVERVTEVDLKREKKRAQFSPYVLTFLDAIFSAWRNNPIK